MNRIEKYNIIKEEIDKWDPIGLLKMGAPENEYSLEITKISSKIDKFNTYQDLGQHIYNILITCFGKYTLIPKIDECIKIAQNIIDRINNENDL